MIKRALLCVVLVSAILLTFSCGQQQDVSGLNKKIEELTEQIAELTKRVDELTERVNAIEPKPEVAVKKLKAGFIYVGPVGDYGWSHAHDMGRKFAEEKLPWLETDYIESVPEADSARIIDRLIQNEKCDVVFNCWIRY